MNMLTKTISRIDYFQRRHRLPGFLYAVIKKYDEDHASSQAALLTYYGFLALFPLLLVLTTVLSAIAGSHSATEQTIIRGTTNYFPVLGTQLSAHIHSLHRSGPALAIGLLFTFYGTRGVADAFRHGVSHIWNVPRSSLPGFPKSLLKNLYLIIVGGAGFVAASVISGYAAAVAHGHSPAFRSLSLAINIFLLFWLFMFLLNASLPRHVTLRETRSGAASAAFGLVVLQSLGSYLLAHELKNLDALYSSFALVLGLLFWIYLQAQVLYYSVEVASVRAQRLYPRSMQGPDLTPADEIIKKQRTN